MPRAWCGATSERREDAVILFSNPPRNIFSWIFVAIIFQTFAKHIHNYSEESFPSEIKNNIKLRKNMIMYTFYISPLLVFLFSSGGCTIFPSWSSTQHIHGRAGGWQKTESENLTHTLYYFNFLLLLFISHFTKSTSPSSCSFCSPFQLFPFHRF